MHTVNPVGPVLANASVSVLCLHSTSVQLHLGLHDYTITVQYTSAVKNIAKNIDTEKWNWYRLKENKETLSET